MTDALGAARKIKTHPTKTAADRTAMTPSPDRQALNATPPDRKATGRAAMAMSVRISFSACLAG